MSNRAPRLNHSSPLRCLSEY